MLHAAHLGLTHLLAPEGIPGSAVHLLLTLTAEARCHAALITSSTMAKVTLTITRVMSTNKCLVADVAAQWDGVRTLGSLGGKRELAAGA